MRLRSALILPLLTFLHSAAQAQQSASYPGSGLENPADPLPYAVDLFEGQPELVPVHHSAVDLVERKGQRTAVYVQGFAANPPATTFEIQGAHARTALHYAMPAFYVHPESAATAGSHSPNTLNPTFAIVQALSAPNRRVFRRTKTLAHSQDAAGTVGVIESTTEHLPSGWIKITPKLPLPPGEYALTPVFNRPKTHPEMVYDFSIDPWAPNAPDVIAAPDLDSGSH